MWPRRGPPGPFLEGIELSTNLDITSKPPGPVNGPTLYSFITLRREAEGGFLFNPYLHNEIPLNDLELSILEECTGNRTVEEIIAAAVLSSGIPRHVARSLVNETFEKATKHCAINWSPSSDRLGSGGPASLGHLVKPTGLPPSSFRLSAPLSVLWEITHRCNLRCSHCLTEAGGAGEGGPSLEEVRYILEQLHGMRVFKITFGGGEPLVRPDILEVLEMVTERDMGIRLTTNGMRVDDELIERLETTNVTSVQVSIDGLESTHNGLRGDERSFDRAVDAVRMFSEAGYWTLVTTAVSRTNAWEVEAILDIAVEAGASAFKPSPFVPVGRAVENYEELRIGRGETMQLARRLFARRSNLPEHFQLQMDGVFPWLLAEACVPPCGEIGTDDRVGCSAGHSQAVITPTGDVLPCAFLREHVVGNMLEEDLASIWANDVAFEPFRGMTRADLKGMCRDCMHIPEHCLGGCRAAAHAFTGDLRETDVHCWKGLLDNY